MGFTISTENFKCRKHFLVFLLNWPRFSGSTIRVLKVSCAVARARKLLLSCERSKMAIKLIQITCSQIHGRKKGLRKVPLYSSTFGERGWSVASASDELLRVRKLVSI